jgi:hypothetical protein
MNPLHPKAPGTNPDFFWNRRTLLGGGGLMLGALAAEELLGTAARGTAPAQTAAPAPARLFQTHAAKAKSVIFLHMVGAPSQLDLFDHKPVLQKFDRQPAPKEFVEGKRFAFLRGHPKLLGTRYRFEQQGRSGAWMSELLPHLGQVADEMTFIRSMTTSEFNHAPAQLAFHTGRNRQGNPSLGAWVDYGLGSLNRDLPSYVVFVSGGLPGGGANLWGSGFLPSVHQGIEFRSQGEPVLFLQNPAAVDSARRRKVLDGISELNAQQHARMQDPEILTRIQQYEMAFRMQTSVPGLMNLSGESPATLAAYGRGNFARQCLLARRLVEEGVRFVELFHRDWDTHGSMHGRLTSLCREVDQPIAALLLDLKSRGLLESTLVVFAGEFGRTPMLQGTESPDGAGRDHHKEAFTVWLAGGGIRPGVQYGATDELGHSVAENPVHVRDLHGTLMHLLGMDHRKLTFRYQGLDQRLTGVEEARILRELLA